MRYLLDLTLIAAGMLVIAAVVASGEHDEDEDYRRALSGPGNDRYQGECGGCHMAYPPQLLPARSWQALMDGLADHFGDNAELDATVVAEIRDFLVDNAADRAGAGRTAAFAGASSRAAPLRISETGWFLRKHDEVPARMVSGNPEVGSFSRCQACHRKAEAGVFNEHSVDVPGYGRWDD